MSTGVEKKMDILSVLIRIGGAWMGRAYLVCVLGEVKRIVRRISRLDAVDGYWILVFVVG